MNRRWIGLSLLVMMIATVAIASEPVSSSVKVKFYGKVKADASWDDSRTSHGTFVAWADRENKTGNAKAKDDSKFNMTARETRFGFNMSGPKALGADVSAKFEVDFFGGYRYTSINNTKGADNNKGELYMRHGFINMNWADNDTKLIFGQTWDIVAPLNPTTLNYPVLWWCGNTGYRRAQVSYHQGIRLGESTKLKVQAGIFDQLGGTFANTGGDAAAPNVQGRVAVEFPLGGPKPVAIGVSGTYGKELNDAPAGGSGRDFKIEGLFLDVCVPITNWLTVKGEAFSGKNLATFLGGIGQGINTGFTPDREIKSKGGWIAGSLGPWNKFAFNVGAGIDDPEDNDLTTANQRLKNQCIFINALYKASKQLTFGLELSNWKTRFRVGTSGSHDAKANRVQASAIYSFY